jgi:chorismate mutase
VEELEVNVEEGWIGIEDEEDMVELEEVSGVIEGINVVKSCADEDCVTVPVSETSELVRVFAAAQAARLNPWFRPLGEFLGITRVKKNCTFGQHVVPPLAPLAQ